MAHTLYSNVILENKMTNLVNSTLDVNPLMTIDDSLEASAGLVKRINKYTYTGEVEQLAKGAKNTKKGTVTFVGTDYTVKRYQQTFVYNDMDVMQDPYILDVAAQGAADVMANQIRTEYFGELAKISNVFPLAADTTFNYDAVVDALATIGAEVESDMFLVIGTDLRAAIRKDENFIYAKAGEILFTGQIGFICGLPIVVSKLVPAGTAYITTKEAVKFFVKKAGTVEQDKDIESKDNTVVYERHGLIALVDESKSVKITTDEPGDDDTPDEDDED